MFVVNLYRLQTKFGAMLYVYRCVSVHGGVPGPGGCLVPGAIAWSWGGGVPGPVRGLVWRVPGGDPHSP